MITISAKYFPGLKRGHSRKTGQNTAYTKCGRCGVYDPKTCDQDPAKAAEAYRESRGKPEHFSPLKKAKEEGFVGGETRLVRGSAVILPFAYAERVQIEIPALNAKFGAKKEYPQGHAGTLVGRDTHSKTFLLKLEKAWKKSKEEVIKELWVPAALLARA